MKETEIKLVKEASGGSKQAFEKLVIRYQRRIYGYARTRISSPSDAGDVVQDTFLKAYSHLNTLKEPAFFSQWLFRICKNCLYSRLRVKKREKDHEVFEDVSDIRLADDKDELLGESIRQEWNTYFDSLRMAISCLNRELKEVVQLKYFAGLSYQQIGITCGIDVKLVKSRLYEGRQKIKKQLPNLYQGLEYEYHHFHTTKEEIMKSIKNISNGAYVFERLSLYHQTALCLSVQSGGKFDDQLLAGINKVKGGTDFITGYNARLSLPELVNILTYIDVNSELRLFGELDESFPEFSESLKQNMFVFEDLILFDQSALQVLYEHIDHLILKTALSYTTPQVRNHILDTLPEVSKEEWLEQIINISPYTKEVKDAQYQVIYECFKMVEEGKVMVNRTSEGVSISSQKD